MALAIMIWYLARFIGLSVLMDIACIIFQQQGRRAALAGESKPGWDEFSPCWVEAPVCPEYRAERALLCILLNTHQIR